VFAVETIFTIDAAAFLDDISADQSLQPISTQQTKLLGAKRENKLSFFELNKMHPTIRQLIPQLRP
jgi:hypothetical protein